MTVQFDAIVVGAGQSGLAVSYYLRKYGADFIVLGSRPSDIVAAWQLARRTMRIVRQNLAWAAIYNAASVPLALIGWLPPWLAGLGMALSSLLVVGNAVRLARAADEPAAPSSSPISAAQVALAWVLAQGDDVVPIPGTRTPSRVDENAGACAVAPRLTAGHLARLDTAADVVTGDRNIVSDPRWISSGRE